MNLFWDAFYGILPQMSSNLYKIFTSEAIKLSQKNEFLTLIAFRFTLSWRYIIVVSFISIAFVVVKLKISNVLRTDSASTKWPFLGDFWVLTPPIWSNIAAILTIVSTLANKNTVWKFLKNSSIYGKRKDAKLALWVQLWPLFSSLRWSKSKKISSIAEKRQSLSYPNMSKWSLYLLSPFREECDYFLQYLG